MIAPFDVFKRVDNEDVLWLASARTIEEAHDRVAKALLATPGASFIIVNQSTGERHLIPPPTSQAS